MRAAVIERGVVEPGEDLDEALDRVVGKMRIGDMALHAGHLQPAVQAAAPPDLDGLAEPRGIGRLAHQAMVEALALLRHPFEHLAGAVDGGAFLVAGDEKADRAVDLPPARLDIIERRRDEAGDRSLHVGGASSIEHAAEDVCGEGRMPPELRVARRHHVGMAGEAKMRRSFAHSRVEILDPLVPFAEAQMLAHEARRLERLNEHLDCARIARGHALAADQALRERHRLIAEHGHCVSTMTANTAGRKPGRGAAGASTTAARIVFA